MDTLLIVDDEPHIVELIALYAGQSGFATLIARDGERALQIIGHDAPDLVVLDLMLPKINGWDVCKRARLNSNVPIIMLTARSDDVDKIVGLEIGADDYLTKPFNPRELMARARAILRRGRSELTGLAHAHITVGALRLAPAQREAGIAGAALRLRPREFDLLHLFASHPGIVFTREALLERVWGFDFAGETRTVDVHVAGLRRHLAGGGVEIETVFGVGYKLVAR